MPISRMLQQLDNEGLWEGFILNGTAYYEGALLRMSAGVNPRGLPWRLNDLVYQPLPITSEGFEAAVGQLAVPKVTVANVAGILSGALLAWEDLIGFSLTRIRTFVRYLDAANWDEPPAWNYPDPEAVRVEEWIIDRKLSETASAVTWELCSPWERIATRRIPNRPILGRTCSSIYKGTQCGWTPDLAGYTPLYFTAQNAPTSAAYDQCGLTLNACRARFQTRWGSDVAVRFAGFPGVQTKNTNG